MPGNATGQIQIRTNPDEGVFQREYVLVTAPLEEEKTGIRGEEQEEILEAQTRIGHKTFIPYNDPQGRENSRRSLRPEATARRTNWTT